MLLKSPLGITNLFLAVYLLNKRKGRLNVKAFLHTEPESAHLLCHRQGCWNKFSALDLGEQQGQPGKGNPAQELVLFVALPHKDLDAEHLPTVRASIRAVQHPLDGCVYHLLLGFYYV